MKYFNKLLLICCLSFCLFAEEDEIRTVVIQGVTYKADPSSGNLTTYDGVIEANEVMDEVKNISNSSSSIYKENNKITETTDSRRKVFANLGQLNPIGDAADSYDAGSSIGFSMLLPRKLTLFNTEFSTGIEANFSSHGSSINNIDDLKINHIAYHMISNFGLPIDFDFGLSVVHHSEKGISGSAMLDLVYNLPINNVDLSLVLRINKLVDIKDGFELDFAAFDAYGLYLKYGQSINF